MAIFARRNATPKRLRLGIPGSRIECEIASETESGRVRKVKETWTAAWARSLPAGAVFYDVGANIGIMSLLACEDPAKRVRALAFEPAVTNFGSLLRNIEINGLRDRILPLAIGLGDRTGLQDFNYQNLEAGGALHSFAGIIPFKPERSVTPVLSLPTLCYRLDDFVAIAHVPFPTHLKIDVDGTEPAILAGAAATLADPRLAEIQVEVVDFTPAEEGSRQVHRLMAEHGFAAPQAFSHNDNYPRCRDYRYARAG